MHTSKIPVLLLAIAGIVSCFLPWANTLIFGQSNLVHGTQFAEGGFMMICFVLIAILSMIHTRQVAFCNGFCKGILIISTLATAISVYKIYIINYQTQKMLAFGVDSNAFMKYNPAYGLYLSAAISGSILLYFSLQLIFRNKRVVMPSAWLEPTAAGRFYIPAHHNTSL
jgi:hypothetical protein